MRVEELVGQRVKQARERQGITQEQLGEWLEPLLGRPWARQAVSTAEQGKRAFTAAELVAIAYVVGVAPHVLLQMPPGVDAVEMPSGSFLTREDLSKAAHTGEGGPGVAAERVQQRLSELMQEVEGVNAKTKGIKRTIERLHDDIAQAVSASPLSADERGGS